MIICTYIYKTKKLALFNIPVDDRNQLREKKMYTINVGKPKVKS